MNDRVGARSEHPGRAQATPPSVGVYALVILASAVCALIWAAHRARAICVLSVRRGRVLVLRGNLPSSLLDALAEVVDRQGTVRGTVSILRDGERARIEASGLDEYALQRARNVLGTYPLARLLAGPVRSRNLGQRLGLAWLSWRLHDAEQRRREPASRA